MDADQLESIPLFSELSDEQRRLVADRLTETTVDVGAVLAREGDFAYNLFVVRDGLAAVASHDTVHTTLRHGDWFGEIGLLTKGMRTANVVALSPMVLLTMPVWDFSDVMREVPELAKRVRERAAEHLERE